MIHIKVKENSISADTDRLLTSGTKGECVQFTFSSEWDGLSKVAVFRAGNVLSDVLETQWADNICTIPQDVLQTPGECLKIGVYGCSADGKLAIPTRYVSLGCIRKGAIPSGQTPSRPSAPMWAQVLHLIGDTTKLSTQAQESLVDAINEIAAKSGGLSNMRVSNGMLQYTYDGSAWTDLLALSTLKGEPGAAGAAGPAGPAGPKGEDGTATDAQVASAVTAYLTAHPEASTTVQDGSVTPRKTSFITYEPGQSWTETAANFTNQLPISTDTDGSVFQGTGYQSGYRYNSSGVLTAAEGMQLTGFIPAKAGDTLRTSGIFTGDGSMEQVSLWAANKTFVGYISRNNLVSAHGAVLGADRGLTWTIATTGDTLQAKLNKTAYLRVSAKGIDSGAILTVNQAIDYTTIVHQGEDGNFALANTVAVPGLNGLEDRVAALEDGGNTAPAYVLAEADSVAQRVLALQHSGTLTLAILSDAHVPLNAATAAAVLHAGQGLARIRQQVHVDAFVMLGDYVKGGSISTLTESKEAISYVNRCIHEAGLGVPNFRLNGNHDCNPYNADGTLSATQLYAGIGAHSSGGMGGDRNYGYVDFAGARTRVIYLNTCDVGEIAVKANDGSSFSGHRVSPTQLSWLVSALDMSGKSGWSLLVLGHTPLNWPAAGYTDQAGGTWSLTVQPALALLDAYVSGGAGSVTMEGSVIPYDFAGKNDAQLLAYIHGHTHNLNTGTMGANNILRIAMPNACPGRNNEYAGASSEAYSQFGDTATYNKTAGTAQDTACSLLTVDPAAGKLYCTNYGAGTDRSWTL